MRFRCWVVGALGLVCQTVGGAEVDYARDIKPLLEAKCAACHGALKQQAGLRLDAIQLLRIGGDSGTAVQPGDLAASPIWQRVTAADGLPRMPPEGDGEPLTAAQLDSLKAWIQNGARGPAEEEVPADPRQHWSYRAPVRPELPQVAHPKWVRTPIDTFIAARLEAEGLAPRQEASRAVWLRRVYLDLVGYPPRGDELQAFLADERPDAYERVVDSLLEQPAYGERWGRHWMDVWRYSDWYGSRGINQIRYSQRHIWRWRDWIIESLNADRPYDRMLTEMLAGDELAPLDADTYRATGFLGRNWYKFDRNVWMFDTVEQTGQAFLGVTFRCARCHDHKFDPITQEEYYRFRAFFEPHDVRTDPLDPNGPTEKDGGPIPKVGISRVFDKQPEVATYLFERGDSRYPDESRRLKPGVPAALGVMSSEVEPVALPPEAYYPALKADYADTLIRQTETAIEQTRSEKAALQQAARKAQAEVARQTAAGDTALPPAFLDDDFSTPRPETWKVVSGNWSWQNGRLVQSQVGNFLTLVTTENHPRNFTAKVRYRTLPDGDYRSVGFSFDQNGPGDSQDVYTSTNDRSQSIQAFHRKGGKQEYPAAGIVKTPLKVNEDVTVEVAVREQSLTIRLNGEKKLDYVMPVARRDGKFALWVHNGAAEFLGVEIREHALTLQDLQEAEFVARDKAALAELKVATAVAARDAAQARLAAERAKYFGTATGDELRQLAMAAAAAEKALAAAQAAEKVLSAQQHLAAVQRAIPAETETPPPALAEAMKMQAAADEAHQKAVAACSEPGEAYTPLGELYPTTSTGRRLALAQWITNPENPRTSRVAVNQIWLRHFGQALVASVADFGLHGKSPTHPELLDWLAMELVQEGWRMKPLHRQIVLSATYRQSTADSAPSAWEQTSQEQAASPNERDPTNRWLWRMNSRRMEAEVVRDSVLSLSGLLENTPGGPEIPESEGQTNYRRSLYFRLTPNEKMSLLETFDVADPNGCYQRKESVVPHQALALMNSSLALESARQLADQITQRLGDDEAATRQKFIHAAFEQVLTRQPTAEEETACLAFLEQHSQLLQTGGGTPFPAGAGVRRAPSPQPALRARENLVHVLFNHNDFVTIR